MRKRSPAFLFVLVFLSSCGVQRDTETGLRQTTIRVAHFGGIHSTEIFDEIVGEWDTQHPHITVKLERTVGSQYLTKLLTGYASGSAPDVCWVENHHMPALFGKGALMPLNDFIASDPAIDIKEYWPEEIERFTVNGKLFALPNDTAPVACIYYNKSAFDKAGLPYPQDDWDWNAFLHAAKKLTLRDEEGHVTQYGFAGWAWQSWVYSRGGRMVDDVQNPRKCVLDSPEAIAGLEFFFDLRREHHVMPAPTEMSALGMAATRMFSSGKVAMFNTGIWNSSFFNKIRDFDWDIAMFPKYPGTDHSRFATGGSGWGVLKTTRHPKEAWEVVKLMGGERIQTRLAGTGNFQPAIMRLARSKDIWLKCPPKPANKQLLNEAVAYAIYDPFTPNWNEISDMVIQPEFDKVWLGRQSVEEAVARIVPRFTALLAEARADRPDSFRR
ncbi:MAG: sugar ABC transporter substrate-binding protein [Planctomycetes bacterium]|nr:sugar ABC transporter substrate-binding protein [Planctomycetota bacterium]